MCRRHPNANKTVASWISATPGVGARLGPRRAYRCCRIAGGPSGLKTVALPICVIYPDSQAAFIDLVLHFSTQIVNGCGQIIQRTRLERDLEVVTSLLQIIDVITARLADVGNQNIICRSIVNDVGIKASRPWTYITISAQRTIIGSKTICCWAVGERPAHQPSPLGWYSRNRFHHSSAG